VEAREQGEYELSTRLEESGLKPLPEPPIKNDPLLMLGQLERFTAQINENVDNHLHKLALTTQLGAQ
jgi:hypothetical protein